MQRTLILSLLVASAAVALGIGAYSAMADSEPGSGVGSPVVGVEEPDNGGTVDAEDADEVDGDGLQAKGARHVARVIADEFGTSQEDVLTLREEGMGFGALFKLHALAAAMDTSVDDLLATMPADGDGGYEFGFGKLRKALAEDQLVVYKSGPKNLGQLVSASHRLEHAGLGGGDEAASAGLEKAREKFAAHASNGHGPPETVPVRGRR